MPVQTRSQTKALHPHPLLSLLPVEYQRRRENNEHRRELEQVYQDHSFLHHLGDTFKEMYLALHCTTTQPIPLLHSQWKLMSFHDVIQHYTTKTQNNPQCQNIDFAFLYDGMGFYVVCSYCIQTNSFYYRHDGGGNAYDVEFNFNFSTHCVPSENQSFELAQWIQDVHQDKEIHMLNVVYA
jgi:hypothetical protein